MANGKIVVGLDIGTTKICAVVAAKDDFGKVNVLGVGKARSEGVSRAAVVNINKTVDAIREAIKEAEHTSGIRKIKGVNVGISGEHVQCLRANAEVSINQSQIVNYTDVQRFVEKAEKNLKYLDMERQVIHTIPQEFIVDDQEGVLDPIGMFGQTMRGSVYVVVGMKTRIRNIQQCIETAGLTINGMTFEPIASGLAVIKESERKSGVVIIDIGGGTSDIAIYTNGVIRHSEVVKVAAFDVTNDVAIGLKTLPQVAEDLKIRHGCAYAPDIIRDEEIHVQGIEGRAAKSFMRSQLTNIIEARMTEIFEYVRATLKKSGYYDYMNAGAIITGGGSLVQGTQALAQDILGLDVRIGNPEGISGGMIGEVNSPIYATAVGLILRALRDVEQSEQNASMQQQANVTAQVQRDEAKVQSVKVPEQIPVLANGEEEEKDNKLLSKFKSWFDGI